MNFFLILEAVQRCAASLSGVNYMTDQQMTAIRAMRMVGQSYVSIADTLGLSMNTVKSYGRRYCAVAPDIPADPNLRFCPQCGIPYHQPAGRKPKRFCSDRCRLKWWHEHRDQSASARQVECPTCGQTFAARRGQKYCCHPCYVSARFGDAQRKRKRRRVRETRVVSASPLVRSATFLRRCSSIKTS